MTVTVVVVVGGGGGSGGGGSSSVGTSYAVADLTTGIVTMNATTGTAPAATTCT
jgi:hypothetical protein